MRLDREFKFSEKIVLLVLAVLMCVLVYILAVHYPVKNVSAEAYARKETAEVKLMEEQARASQKANMEKKVTEAQEANQSVLADYDNLKNVISFLNGVMQETESYNLSFREVVRKDYVAERPIDVTFECVGYANAERIIRNLQRSPYSCKVYDLSIAAKSNGAKADIVNSVVDVQCVVKFYEYNNTETEVKNEVQ